MLPKDIAEQLARTLISSRLDYCNSLFTCLNDRAVAQLQLMQNAAARFLTNTWRREHITWVLAELYRLPIQYNLFTIIVITFKSLHGLALLYFLLLFTPYCAPTPSYQRIKCC